MYFSIPFLLIFLILPSLLTKYVSVELLQGNPNFKKSTFFQCSINTPPNLGIYGITDTRLEVL